MSLFMLLLMPRDIFIQIKKLIIIYKISTVGSHRIRPLPKTFSIEFLLFI